MAGNGEIIIAAPPATPPRLGLLASAARPDVGDRVHWPNGLVLRPEATRGADLLDGGAWWDCIGDGGSEPGDKTPGPANPDFVYYRPWQVVEGETCGATGFQQNDYIGRARRRLAANESWKVERELWLGEVAQAAGYPNDYLANPATVDDLGTLPLVYALAELQTYLADTIPGRGMIHATVRTCTLWQSAMVVRREGNLLLDIMDNIVVPGTGYTGDGPEYGTASVLGSTEWAYATGMVQLLEGDVTVTPDNFSDALHKAHNRVTYEAERYVAAFHDGEAHAGVLVDLCNTCCS